MSKQKMDLSTKPNNPNMKNGQGNDGFIKNPTESRDKNKLKRMFEHQHMVETIERFEYDGLPDELDEDLIERILYFRFKGAAFKYNDNYYFLPFTLSGTIDSYGRYMHISPVLFTGQLKTVNGKKVDTAFLPETATDVKFQVRYNKKQEKTEYDAVILTDSSLAISQDWEPMNTIISPLIEQMTDILVLLNIDLVSSAKVFYIVAKDADQKTAIENEFQDIDTDILGGKRVIVLNSQTELKELQGSSAKDSARYMQSFQSVTNIRKSIIGTDTGGAFLKQEHMTDAETETNGNDGGAVINNALRMRQKWCDLMNDTFGLNMSVKLKVNKSETTIEKQGSQTKQSEGEE